MKDDCARMSDLYGMRDELLEHISRLEAKVEGLASRPDQRKYEAIRSMSDADFDRLLERAGG
mgnify:CR=1 FL=1